MLSLALKICYGKQGIKSKQDCKYMWIGLPKISYEMKQNRHDISRNSLYANNN